MNLIKKIKQEKITLTDRVMVFNKQMETIDKDYFIYWKVGKPTKWEKGIIVLVDNGLIENSFREAFNKKYGLGIPNTKMYDYLIKQRLEKVRKFYE